MRLAIYAAVFLLLQAAVPASAGGDWQTFNDPTGMFSISVPEPMSASNATTTRHDGSTVKVIVYDLTRAPDDELMIRIADFTGQNVDPATAVEGAVKGIAAKYTLVSQEAETLDGHAGQSIVLTDAAGLHYTDRIFFLEDHLFQVLTVSPKDVTADQSERVARFSRSLQILR